MDASTPPLAGTEFQSQVNRTVGLDTYFMGLLTEDRMPCDQLVFAGRYLVYLERAILTGKGVVGIVHTVEPILHVRMLVTLQLDNLALLELDRQFQLPIPLQILIVEAFPHTTLDFVGVRAVLHRILIVKT